MVVFGQKCLCWGCVDVFRKKLFSSGKIVVFGQKLLYSDESDCIRAN